MRVYIINIQYVGMYVYVFILRSLIEPWKKWLFTTPYLINFEKAVLSSFINKKFNASKAQIIN